RVVDDNLDYAQKPQHGDERRARDLQEEVMIALASAVGRRRPADNGKDDDGQDEAAAEKDDERQARSGQTPDEIDSPKQHGARSNPIAGRRSGRSAPGKEKTSGIRRSCLRMAPGGPSGAPVAARCRRTARQ